MEASFPRDEVADGVQRWNNNRHPNEGTHTLRIIPRNGLATGRQRRRDKQNPIEGSQALKKLPRDELTDGIHRWNNNQQPTEFWKTITQRKAPKLWKNFLMMNLQMVFNDETTTIIRWKPPFLVMK